MNEMTGENMNESMNGTDPECSGRPEDTSDAGTSEAGAWAGISEAETSGSFPPDDLILKVTCPCGSGLGINVCCGPRMDGRTPPRTPVELLRTRFCAYCLQMYDYLVATQLPSGDEDALTAEHLAERLAERLNDVLWISLDILGEGHDEDRDCPYVDFRAYYDMPDGRHVLSERSFFREVDGTWFYVDGEPLKIEGVRREGPKVGRNDPCPCGSGKKYKKCCGAGK